MPDGTDAQVPSLPSESAVEPDIAAPADEPGPDAEVLQRGRRTSPCTDATVAAGQESIQQAGPDPVAEDAPTGRHAERPDTDRF